MAYNDFVTNILNADRDAIDLGHILNDEPNKQVPTRLGRLVWTIATINHRVDIVTTQANQKLTELQAAINTAAAAGAGAAGWTADLVLNKSGETQQQVNYSGGSKWHSRVGGYLENERVVLANGDIVRSTIDGNVNNPNVNMTGWVNPSELQALHNQSSATLTDYLTASEIANSATTDLSAKLQAINDSDIVSTLRITKGVYLINSLVTFNRNFSFDFDPDAIFKLGVNGGFAFTGSATLVGKPTANISTSDKTISIANTLSAYDLICIYNPTDYSFSPARNYYRAGEFIKVVAATSTNVTIAGHTWDDYIATDVDVYKINPIKIDFNTYNIDATDSILSTPVKFTFCSELDASKYQNKNSKVAGISFDRCYDVSISDVRATNMAALTGNNYGVSLANCQYVKIDGASSHAVRHCITTGGGTDICSIPTREVFITNSTIKNGSTTNITSADFHGNTAESSYKNCVLDGVSIGGRNNTLHGCTIIGRTLDSLAISLSEIQGGYLDIIDCNIVADSNISANYGVIRIVIEYNPVTDLTINIRNLKINGKSLGAYNLIKLVTSPSIVLDGTKKIKVVLDGIECNLTNHAALINAQGGAAQPIIPNMEIVVTGKIDTVKKNVFYVHPTTTATDPATVLKLPVQRGSELVTTSGETTGLKLGALITLPYSYPVPPNVLHSVGTDGTWTVGSTFNLKPVSAMLSHNTQNQVRFTLISPASLPSKTFKISYQVGL